MTRRFATETKVPVEKSRAEIGTLLYQWGALNVNWIDDHERDAVVLRFVWADQYEARYAARFVLPLTPASLLRERCVDRRNGQPSKKKLSAAFRGRGRAEHRQLLLLLKAAFNAIAAGLIMPEAFFLPFLETDDGRTVGEKLIAFREGVGVRALLSAGDRK